MPTERQTDPSLGLAQGALRLVPHNPGWASLFEDERDLILAQLPSQIANVHHIGSTAVPGLSAKPILDLALTAPSEAHETIAAALVQLGYIDRGERDGRLFIRMAKNDLRTHNLHLYAEHDSAFADHIAFRDALRRDATLRTAYTELKQQLVRDFAGNRAGYAPAKSDFVAAVLRAHRTVGP